MKTKTTTKKTDIQEKSEAQIRYETAQQQPNFMSPGDNVYYNNDQSITYRILNISKGVVTAESNTSAKFKVQANLSSFRKIS